MTFSVLRDSGAFDRPPVSHPDDRFRGNTDDNLDAPRFFHVDPSNHLIVQRVVLVTISFNRSNRSKAKVSPKFSRDHRRDVPPPEGPSQQFFLTFRHGAVP